MQAATLVTLATHTDIITSPRHTEQSPCKVWKLWSGAGMQPPSLWYQSHPYRHHHPGTSSPHHPDTAALTLVPVTPIPTSSPRHIITTSPRHTEQSPCKVWKQWSGAGMQPPSLAPVATAKRICMIKPIFSLTYKFGRPRHIITSSPGNHPARYGSNGAGQGCSRPHSGTSHTHTDIITPAHHHHITPTHMEAMERGRVQPPSLAPVAALIHPDIITSSYYPARYGSNGAGQGCRRPHR